LGGKAQQGGVRFSPLSTARALFSLPCNGMGAFLFTDDVGIENQLQRTQICKAATPSPNNAIMKIRKSKALIKGGES
jgi:hypothetical protein